MSTPPGAGPPAGSPLTSPAAQRKSDERGSVHTRLCPWGGLRAEGRRGLPGGGSGGRSPAPAADSPLPTRAAERGWPHYMAERGPRWRVVTPTRVSQQLNCSCPFRTTPPTISLSHTCLLPVPRPPRGARPAAGGERCISQQPRLPCPRRGVGPSVCPGGLEQGTQVQGAGPKPGCAPSPQHGPHSEPGLSTGVPSQVTTRGPELVGPPTRGMGPACPRRCSGLCRQVLSWWRGEGTTCSPACQQEPGPCSGREQTARRPQRGHAGEAPGPCSPPRPQHGCGSPWAGGQEPTWAPERPHGHIGQVNEPP